ncbi:MAG: ABC transporter transmembrane domain-containing protein, partial [Alphaproteobacteria bacterium]|nr:ABC transporter transmembrane domain-containing protein [Alphaproteobacteria bacterium]
MGTLVQTSRVWSLLEQAFSFFGFAPDIWVVAFLSSLFLIARQLLTYIRIVYQAAMSYMIARRMRESLFSGFLKAKLNYQERLFSGPFANSITTETNAASQVISTFLEFLNGVTITLAYVGLLVWLSPGAAVIVIGVLGVVGFSMRGIQRKIGSLGREIVNVNARFSQHFLEKCATVRLIRLTSSEELELFQARRLLSRQEKKNVSAIKAVAITATGIEPMALVIGIPVLIGAVVIGGADVATIGM